MNKARFSAFSDAIIAIEVTLLVLEISAPTKPTFTAIFAQTGLIAAYVVSFGLIFVTWYNHHNLINLAQLIDTRVYFANTLWIFSMSLLPLATVWVGRYPSHFLPEFSYLFISLIWLSTYNLLVFALARTNPKQKEALYRVGGATRGLISFHYLVVLLSMVLCFWSPFFGIGGILLLTVSSVIPHLSRLGPAITMNRERLLGFTDGIIAIIVTLIVLQIAIPNGTNLAALLAQRSKFLAYVISFTFIMVVWYTHHELFNNTKRITTQLYWDNVLWLLWLSFFPWVTSFVGSFPNARLSEWLYVGVQLLWSLSYTKMVHDFQRTSSDAPFTGKQSGYHAWTLYAGLTIALIGIYFLPVSGLIITVLLALSSLVRTWRAK